MNSNASRKNVAVEFRKESHTRSVSASDTKVFYKQKTRHLTTANYYKLRDKVILTAEPFSRVLFYSAFIILISNLYMWPVVVGIFVTRSILQFIVFSLNQRRFNEQGILPWTPVFDILSPFINALLYAGSLRQGTGKNKWK